MRKASLLVGIALLLPACSTEQSVDVGDCLNDLKIPRPRIVSCEREHSGEVVGKYVAEGSEYPGAEALQDDAKQPCEDAFQEYVGSPASESIYDLAPLIPTKSSWDDRDDREVLCVARASDGTPLVESLRN